jgi:hypothetical protein
MSKGYGREKIERLFLFLDALIKLPEEMDKVYEEECIKLKGGREKMGLSIFDSRIATNFYSEVREEARREGKKKGLLEAIRLSLAVKFGSESLGVMPIIEKIEESETLKGLLEQILRANGLEEVKRYLQ